MKRTDLFFALAIVAIFLPFALSDALYDAYKLFNAEHGMVMSFLKFGVLSTLGEMLGGRISSGKYIAPAFGVLPRAIVWGFLGMGINMAMIIFSKGTPLFLEYMGMTNAVQSFVADGFTMDKLWVALAVSVAMNTIFAPVFMTFHKITDAHIAVHGGKLKALLTNPARLAFYVSFPLFLLGIKLPTPVATTVELAGRMSTPLCMIALGMRLASTPFRRIVTDKYAWLACAGKLVVMPLLALLSVRFLPIPDYFKATLFLLSCCPTASAVQNFSEIYLPDTETEGKNTAADSILLSNILCMLTIPVMAMLL